MVMNIDRHVRAHVDMFHHLAGGDMEKADQTKAFYDEYFAVLDLTAEFYLETVQRVFQEHLLPLGALDIPQPQGQSRGDPPHRAAHRRGRTRRHLFGRPDRGRA